ncbi:MAG: hypothetical protein HPY69_16240 [Armatimonadetes bacterium]|nr:hypothetical protein [Armatimonadota bacterium]
MLLVIVWGLLLLSETSDAQVERATIVLRDKVTVDTAEILLPQVAAIAGPEDAVYALGQVSLGSAPVPGTSRTVAVDYVRLRLKRYGLALDSLDIQGQVVVIHRDAEASDAPASAARTPCSAATATPLPSPDVRRNDEVHVAVRCRGVTVGLTGRALQNGCVGDLIRVQIPQTSRTVEATVIGPGQLAMQLQGGQPYAQ